MFIDAPLTVYKHDKDKKEETVQEKKARMNDIVEKWKKKKAEGKGVNLSDFLGEGAKKFDNSAFENNDGTKTTYNESAKI